jgi:hypothetical protein
MTKSEAIAIIQGIEGMGGSRAVALVDALDALGLLRLAGQLAETIQTLSDAQKFASHPPGFREIKNGIASNDGTKYLVPVEADD